MLPLWDWFSTVRGPLEYNVIVCTAETWAWWKWSISELGQGFELPLECLQNMPQQAPRLQPPRLGPRPPLPEEYSGNIPEVFRNLSAMMSQHSVIQKHRHARGWQRVLFSCSRGALNEREFLGGQFHKPQSYVLPCCTAYHAAHGLAEWMGLQTEGLPGGNPSGRPWHL